MMVNFIDIDINPRFESLARSLIGVFVHVAVAVIASSIQAMYRSHVKARLFDISKIVWTGAKYVPVLIGF
jgi:hypothetical protein